ncbi:MAG: ribosome maturation factor RimP [Actinomycetota bacterium]
MAVIDRVRELVAPVVADVGAELYDVEFNGGVLRILVDREGGIDIDSIKTISKSSSRILDDADPIPGRYTLEVSSPGLERPLRLREHYDRAVGELVKIKTFADVDGSRRFTGTLVGADDNGFVLEVDGEPMSFGYDNVSKARTVFEWGGQPKPGGGQKAGPGSATKSKREAQQ